MAKSASRSTATRRLRIQESVFTGLWRVVELDRDGGLLADWIEVGPLPEVVVEAARAGACIGVAAVDIPRAR